MEKTIEELRQEYLHQVNIELPNLSRATGKYPVLYNHCWARLLLDNLWKTCWYNRLDSTKGPAYTQLNEKQLETLLVWCNEIKASPELARLMNANSLRWRQEYE